MPFTARPMRATAPIDKKKKPAYRDASDLSSARGTNAIGTFISTNGVLGSVKKAMQAAKGGNYVGTSTEFRALTNSRILLYPKLPVTSVAMFIAQYYPNGVVNWVARITGTSATAITNHSNGNMTSISNGTSPTIYNSLGNASFITTAGNNNCYIIQYDRDGNPIWGARVGGAATCSGYAVCTDINNNISIAGAYSGGTFTMYDKTGSAVGITLPTGGGYSDMFIVKYSYIGTPQWAARITTNGDEIGYSVSSDSVGNIIVGGIYGIYASGTSPVYNSDATIFGYLPVTSNRDAFLVQYSSTGFVNWMARMKGNFDDSVSSINVDSNNNINIVGNNNGSVAIYDKNDTLFGSTRASSYAFIVQYSSAGLVNWFASLYSQNGITASASCTDSLGNITVTGTYYGGLFLYNSDNTQFLVPNIPSTGSPTAYIAQYSSTGFVNWAAAFSQPLSYPTAISVDSTLNITLSGYYGISTAVNDKNGVPYKTTLANSGSNDGFIVQYSRDGFVKWVASTKGTGDDRIAGSSVGSSDTINIVGSSGSTPLLVTPADVLFYPSV